MNERKTPPACPYCRKPVHVLRTGDGTLYTMHYSEAELLWCRAERERRVAELEEGAGDGG